MQGVLESKLFFIRLHCCFCSSMIGLPAICSHQTWQLSRFLAVCSSVVLYWSLTYVQQQAGWRRWGASWPFHLSPEAHILCNPHQWPAVAPKSHPFLLAQNPSSSSPLSLTELSLTRRHGANQRKRGRRSEEWWTHELFRRTNASFTTGIM